MICAFIFLLVISENQYSSSLLLHLSVPSIYECELGQAIWPPNKFP